MTKIYTHPGQDQMQVEVILASVGKDAPPIYTIRTRYPRIIHGEIMTHRKFGRNARSSRAVPVKTMLNEIRSVPFVPWHWGKNQKGMQADEECNAAVKDWVVGKSTLDNVNGWCQAATQAIAAAEAFSNAGYHKQIVNRLIEPFSWIDTLITATDWKNFLHLRQHRDAEPHLQDLANLVAQAIEETEPTLLEDGDWHLPYITQADRHAPSDWKDGPAVLRKISAARCARISYAPFDGNASYEKELERYDLLVTSERIHASPLEHQAKPDSRFVSILTGDQDEWKFPSSHGNLTGWIQARKLIWGEALRG